MSELLRLHNNSEPSTSLNRYFASRPEIFARSGDDGDGDGRVAAASAVHRALAANPEATSKVVSAGLKHGVPKSSPYSAAVSRLVLQYICNDDDNGFHENIKKRRPTRRSRMLLGE